jgi:preprotein translocase subunit SecY
LVFLVIFRLGSFIVIPGIEPTFWIRTETQEVSLAYLNNFLGGAFNNASIFALGIMPYISASIIVQLLSFAVPYFRNFKRKAIQEENV